MYKCIHNIADFLFYDDLNKYNISQDANKI